MQMLRYLSVRNPQPSPPSRLNLLPSRCRNLPHNLTWKRLIRLPVAIRPTTCRSKAA